GSSVIQIEEPTIHFIACYYPDAKDTLNFLTDALNHVGTGKCGSLDSHLLGQPHDAALFDKTSYADALDIYLNRINCDVLTRGMKDRGMAELELLGNWKGKTKRKFALGVVSHRTLNADTPTEVANEVRKALKYVDIENLLLASDCGYGRQGAKPYGRFLQNRCDWAERQHHPPRVWPAGDHVPCADARPSQDLVAQGFED
ncbi:MAG: hypothetical protein ABR948_29165, partial [Bradyrhizobium sp.]